MQTDSKTTYVEPVGFKGTPGEWEIFENGIGRMFIIALNGSGSICEIDSFFKTKDRELMLANAALIASSPALLTALKWLLDAIPSQNNDHDWWPDELTTAVANAKEILKQAGL